MFSCSRWSVHRCCGASVHNPWDPGATKVMKGRHSEILSQFNYKLEASCRTADITWVQDVQACWYQPSDFTGGGQLDE